MKKILALILILIICSCKNQQKDPRIEILDTYLQGQKEFFNFNGNVLVAEKGKIIYQKSFGYSDYDRKMLLNDSSVFELASVSKQFTATGILLLEKEGKLSTNDSLRKFFPELPYSGISIHHMLTHTSGLQDYMGIIEEKWDHNKIAFNSDMIALMASEKPPVHFKPGQKWEYSNTAFVLLASIIEKVSGMSFKDFMAKNIFKPLKMNHSRVYNTRRSGEIIDNYAYGFVWSDSLNRYMIPDSLTGFEIVYFIDGIQGDGIINTTTTDLLKWDRNLVENKLLGDSFTKKMISKHFLMDTTQQTYSGYGVFIAKDEMGENISHGGGWYGYRTCLTRYVDDDYTIIVLSNNQSAASQISTAIANIIFQKPVEFPYEHKTIIMDTTSLDLFTGNYKIENTKFDIKREKDTLFQVFQSGYSRKFLPESNSKIYAPDRIDLQLEIEKDSTGRSQYFYINYGVRMEIEKLENSQFQN